MAIGAGRYFYRPWGELDKMNGQQRATAAGAFFIFHAAALAH